jgi:hypothetical protein
MIGAANCASSKAALLEQFHGKQVKILPHAAPLCCEKAVVKHRAKTVRHTDEKYVQVGRPSVDRNASKF